MAKKFVGIREVDEEIFRKFRVKTIEEKMKLGYAISLAMNLWMEKERRKEIKPDPRNLLKIKPIKVGTKKVKWSEEVDQILYGKKNDSS